MKILVITDDFPPRTIGGPAIVASNLAFGLKELGHDVRIITTVRDVKDAGMYIHESMPVHALYSNYAPRWRAYRSLYNPSVLKEVKRILKEFKPDVVHAHNVHYHISYHALKMSKKSGAKVILTAHDVMLFHYGKLTEYIDPKNKDIPENPNYHVTARQQIEKYKRWYNPFRNILIKYYLHFVDHVCAVSLEHQKALAQNGIKNTKVVYNGIDTTLWQPNGRAGIEFRKENVLEGRNIIAYVGRLQQPKGSEQILETLKIIAEKDKNVLLLVIGTKDIYGAAMEDWARSHGIGYNIFFTGWLSGEKLQAAYNAADVVVFPSVCFDTFGMVSIEAMAVAKPVVATCFGGAREVVLNDVTGTIVNPYNTDMMAEAIQEFLTNSTKNKMFGLAGRDRVEKEFTLQQQIEKYLVLYKDQEIEKKNKKEDAHN